MNKRTLVFEIIVFVFMLFGILTMFMPFFSVSNKDINTAFNKNFEDLFQSLGLDEDVKPDINISSQSGEDEEIYIIKQKNGFGLIGELMDIKPDRNMKKVSNMKMVSITTLITACVFAAVTIVLMLVLKGKLKYILSMVFSFLSVCSLSSVLFFMPNLIRDALIESIEKKLLNDGGIWEGMLVYTAKKTLLEPAGDFIRDLLQASLKVGFWLFFGCAIAAFIASLVGLILECAIGKKVTKIAARIMALSGEYEGADFEIGQGILIGRSPSSCQLVINSEKISRKHCKVEYNAETGKYIVTDFSSNGTYILGGKRLDENVPTELERGTIIRLGKKGDTFRLG